ncbi:hypothetical protein KZ829_07500 [Actinoplanes hulinensis]|uniref:Uncharacterized protein n=1 Tax=Actinoplanes hulinensis TaxID=1144547 RepID=A0ABS7AXU4_9ACTN|nr:hypothetical protein [Actinoplanes hulinensis]MBW6433589.1 hypothetical protein [Actinoplanes hulinensis]
MDAAAARVAPGGRRPISGGGTEQETLGLTVFERLHSRGAIADLRGASITDGAVGPDVTGVTVHAEKLTAQATVRDGRDVVWWPGPAFTGKDSGCVTPTI